MLLLSRLLAENTEGALSDREVEFAATIHAAGNDLLSLINDILDLSKVEAGRMELDLTDVALSDVCADVERSFRPLANEKGLSFAIEVDPALPASIVSDGQRLGQVLKNLLSNAFKFTHEGGVRLSLGYPADGTEMRSDALRGAGRGDRILGDRHRGGHRRRQAQPDLRGLPTGRRLDLAQVRRHRSGAVDLARDRAAARRRDPGGVRPAPGQPVLAPDPDDAAGAGSRTRARADRAPRTAGGARRGAGDDRRPGPDRARGPHPARDRLRRRARARGARRRARSRRDGDRRRRDFGRPRADPRAPAVGGRAGRRRQARRGGAGRAQAAAGYASPPGGGGRRPGRSPAEPATGRRRVRGALGRRPRPGRRARSRRRAAHTRERRVALLADPAGVDELAAVLGSIDDVEVVRGRPEPRRASRFARAATTSR